MWTIFTGTTFDQRNSLNEHHRLNYIHLCGIMLNAKISDTVISKLQQIKQKTICIAWHQLSAMNLKKKRTGGLILKWLLPYLIINNPRSRHHTYQKISHNYDTPKWRIIYYTFFVVILVNGPYNACKVMWTIVFMQDSSYWVPYITAGLIILFIISFCGGPGICFTAYTWMEIHQTLHTV